MNVPGVRVAGLLCLALWLGAAAFFSFIVAPGAFRALPRADAGRFLGGIFPFYYAFGLALTSVAAWMAVVERRAGLAGPRGDLRVMLLCALVLLQVGGVGTLLWVRAIKAASVAGADPSLNARFGLAHGASMVLNLLSLITGLSAILLSGG